MIERTPEIAQWVELNRPQRRTAANLEETNLPAESDVRWVQAAVAFFFRQSAHRFF